MRIIMPICLVVAGLVIGFNVGIAWLEAKIGPSVDQVLDVNNQLMETVEKQRRLLDAASSLLGECDARLQQDAPGSFHLSPKDKQI